MKTILLYLTLLIAINCQGQYKKANHNNMGKTIHQPHKMTFKDPELLIPATILISGMSYGAYQSYNNNNQQAEVIVATSIITATISHIIIKKMKFGKKKKRLNFYK